MEMNTSRRIRKAEAAGYLKLVDKSLELVDLCRALARPLPLRLGQGFRGHELHVKLPTCTLQYGHGSLMRTR